MEAFCYLTTTGRRTGRLHTIEMWFALEEARSIASPAEMTGRTG